MGRSRSQLPGLVNNCSLPHTISGEDQEPVSQTFYELINPNFERKCVTLMWTSMIGSNNNFARHYSCHNMSKVVTWLEREDQNWYEKIWLWARMRSLVGWIPDAWKSHSENMSSVKFGSKYEHSLSMWSVKWRVILFRAQYVSEFTSDVHRSTI